MRYKLKVLSPLHIGCGDKYSGLNFIIHDRKMFCIDPDIFISEIGEHKVGRFVEWIESCTDAIDRIENQKRILKRKKDPAAKNEIRKLNDLLRHQIQNFTLKKFIKENKMNLGQITGQALYFTIVQKGVYNDTEINPFIKQMNHPYIPGTEIKGAIRTAVLYCSLLENKELFLWLKHKFEKFQKDKSREILDVANNKRPNSRIKKALAKDMAKIESEFQEKVLCSKPKDAKYDVMKYVQIGDSELLDAGKNLAISYVKPFNIFSKFSVFYEYIKPETEISLSMLKLESAKSLKIKLDKMGFNDRQKNIVSGIDKIFNHCYRFSKDLIKEEISFFKAKGKQQIVDQLNGIALLNKHEAPVLRIGKDEGYNSLTVGLAVRNLDKNLYENVLIHATKNKSYDSGHGGPMPKSRKIVYWNGKEMTSGWVQLMPEKDSASQPTSEKQPVNHPRQGQKPATPADLSMLGNKFKVVRKNQ
ncbi:MAG: type III-A CRISPR-associated RAMP protein Csm5 [Pseudomonadota bacterium]